MNDNPSKRRQGLISRRESLMALGAAGSAFALASPALAQTQASRNTALAAGLPIDDPVFNVRTLGRLQADLSGKTVYFYKQGRVFGLQPGRGPAIDEYGRLMYLIEGGSVRASRLRADGSVEERSRNWVFYKDAETNTYLSNFRNPYTGVTVPAPSVFHAGITGAVITPDGPSMVANFHMESTVFDRPMLLDWRFLGDQAWIYRHAFTRWKEASTGTFRTEMTLDCWICKIADVADGGLGVIPSAYSWTSQVEWQSWLKMGDQPGAMLWRNDGTVLNTIDELPKDFVAHCEKVIPGHLTAALD